ncbi:putative endolytic peptidoglycan transglycosylase RlpA [Halotydeus destructor]|nr:putative endolytic peptidoglycan transglycosylase RlpA [Halotydeus destructor]
MFTSVLFFVYLLQVNAMTTVQPETLEEKGICSYYGREVGMNPTASGELFNWNDLTAAHKTLPFGTLIRVINHRNNKSTIVRVNDRGPFTKGRIVDLSFAAAKRMGMIRDGIVPCSFTTVS